MDIERERLETADALQFAGLSRTDWNNALQRGIYPDAPRTEPGQPRQFGLDDLVAAYVLGQLYDRKVMPKFACQIACDVLRAIRKAPKLETLSAWKCRKRDGSPYVAVSEAQPRPDSVELFRFHVGKIRREAIEGIRRKLREQGQ